MVGKMILSLMNAWFLKNTKQKNAIFFFLVKSCQGFAKKAAKKMI